MQFVTRQNMDNGDLISAKIDTSIVPSYIFFSVIKKERLPFSLRTPW